MLFRLRFGRVRAVFLEYPRQGKLAEPVADHVFRHKHRVKNLAVVDAERQADEIRRNHRTPRLGFDRRFLTGALRLLDFIQQVKIYKRAFFNRASHKNYLIFIGRPLRRTIIKRFEYLYLGRVLPPLAILPHGDITCCQPPPDLDLPAPPPFGWSTGLRVTPRLMPR